MFDLRLSGMQRNTSQNRTFNADLLLLLNQGPELTWFVQKVSGLTTENEIDKA